MNKKNSEINQDEQANFADNIAGNAPKEQTNESLPEDNAPDNSEQEDNTPEELEKLKDSYIRLAAEYDNYRKRTIKEKADLIKNGGEKVIVGLLPVVDDFERAMQTLEKASDLSAIKEGIDLIYNKFIKYLQQNGVKPIEVLEQTFDPDLHEAIATIPTDKEKGTVIDSVQTGYTLNDKVIRHAKVVVAN
jgi:molecular chaperone GrpE